jgi:hypothetical protein
VSRERRNTSKEQLSAQELAELREQLSRMSQSDLEINYKATHNACRSPDHLPSPGMMQRLVQAWRELWKRRKRTRLWR